VCKGQANSKIYSFEGIEALEGEKSIATEIITNGPVICGISATNEFKAYTKGIFEDKSGEFNHNHYVMVYGSASKLNTFVENKGDPLPLSLELTPSLSQLTPNYCDASWAFAVIHALADSELARSKGISVRSFSVQALLNCGVGTC